MAEHAKSLHELYRDLPGELIAARLAKAVEDRVKQQVGNTAAQARTQQWPLSAIAEALGLQPTSDPRSLYPNIES
ncbi:hypothetical protein GCM10009720_18000 [Yaniella flava]|uniref:Uncharacterized protein n=1 Tax=Yaniella flava TaxID=287930 RepID=A0ABN2UHU4_9MICC